MELFSCPKCNYTTDASINSLRIHYTKSKHGSAEELWQLLFNGGKSVACKCGCGEVTKFLGIVKGYAEWKRGHISRTKNNWGHNDVALKKSQAIRRQMHKDDEIIVWNKGLTAETDKRVADCARKMNTPERAAKISASLTGVPKTNEHRRKIQEHMSEYWSKDEHRAKQSIRRINHMRTSTTDKWQCYGVCHNVVHDGKTWMLKSNYELQAYRHLCARSDVEKIDYEAIPISYAVGDEGNRIYLPDFLITLSNGVQQIIEIKSEFYLDDPKWAAKELAAWRFAAKNGYTFEVWTEHTHPFLSQKSS